MVAAGGNCGLVWVQAVTPGWWLRAECYGGLVGRAAQKHRGGRGWGQAAAAAPGKRGGGSWLLRRPLRRGGSRAQGRRGSELIRGISEAGQSR